MNNDFKINPKNLKKYMDLDYYTDELFDENGIPISNCYAYSLGLSLPYTSIYNDNDQNAYVVGTISMLYYDMDVSKIKEKSIYERLLLDLDVMDIKYDDITKSNEFSYDKENEWLIALYINSRGGFHFLRKDKKEYWTHKPGFITKPNNLDYKKNIIYDVNECDLGSYEYMRCLKLRK